MVIDGEAGVEQINRRVLDTITHILLVADTSLKSRKVASTIISVANKSVSFQKYGNLFNRIKEEEPMESIVQNSDIPVIGILPEDQQIKEFDKNGESFLNLHHSKAMEQFNSRMEKFLGN